MEPYKVFSWICHILISDSLTRTLQLTQDRLSSCFIMIIYFRAENIYMNVAKPGAVFTSLSFLQQNVIKIHKSYCGL